MKSKLNAILAASVVAFSIAGAAHAQQPSGKMEMNEMMKGMSGMSGMSGCCDKMSSMRMTGNPDVDFASMMREHHKGALAMAEAELKHGKDAGMRDMAKSIIAAQKREIAQFDAFLSKNVDAKARQGTAPAAGKAGGSPAAPAVFADGEVRKVDKEAKKITLKHGEIKNLDMPGMTMAFAVKDDALLDKFKVGDKVQFKAVDDGGKLTVVEIQAAQ